MNQFERITPQNPYEGQGDGFDYTESAQKPDEEKPKPQAQPVLTPPPEGPNFGINTEEQSKDAWSYNVNWLHRKPAP